MSTTKKTPKGNLEDVYAALQALIAQGKKDGMIRAADLNAQLEKMQLTPEKIEEVYDRFESMNIQIVTADLELDLGMMTWAWMTGILTCPAWKKRTW